ncbi:MAG TPA: RNA 2',3'-cyclic phosphodiesterase [Polyangia bacterium]|jgi:2'-5' RNA ligase|nr:RNA 2',3'-cyclic phosphodiesterase [Polyangia bacterium]
MTDSVRSFVAVPLPEEIRTRILVAAQELARALPDVKWFRKLENLHITVKFLGQVEEDKLTALGQDLAQALAPVPRFRLDVRGMGAFPSPRKANVVWAGIAEGAPGLKAVADAVEGVSERFGFAREQRAFTGHVTVGRSVRSKGRGVDARAAIDAFGGRDFGGTTVEEVHVYESRLGGAGSTYVLRSRAALASN